MKTLIILFFVSIMIFVLLTRRRHPRTKMRRYRGYYLIYRKHREDVLHFMKANVVATTMIIPTVIALLCGATYSIYQTGAFIVRQVTGNVSGFWLLCAIVSIPAIHILLWYKKKEWIHNLYFGIGLLLFVSLLNIWGWQTNSSMWLTFHQARGHSWFFWLVNALAVVALWLWLNQSDRDNKKLGKAFLVLALLMFVSNALWTGDRESAGDAYVTRTIETLHTLKKGEVTDTLLLEDIVSRDMVPVEVRFNKPDSLTEFSEWQKVEGGIRFPYPVTFVQYRVLTDTFNVRVRAPMPRS